MTTFGMIGAGKIGSTVARAVLALGHDVILSNSRTPDTLDALVEELGPHASAALASDAAAQADVVLVAIPFGRFREIAAEPLAGKIVLDANNYYFERDGHFPELDRGEATTTGLLQEHLKDAHVAKAFNHIFFKQILTDGTPAGTPGRRALVTSSDHPDAVDFVTDLYDAIGYDTVPIVPLSESWRVERDRPAYLPKQTKDELLENLAQAPRIV